MSSGFVLAAENVNCYPGHGGDRAYAGEDGQYVRSPTICVWRRPVYSRLYGRAEGPVLGWHVVCAVLTSPSCVASGAEGTDVVRGRGVLSLSECQARCMAVDDCTGIMFHPTTHDCWLRKNVVVAQCDRGTRNSNFQLYVIG